MGTPRIAPFNQGCIRCGGLEVSVDILIWDWMGEPKIYEGGLTLILQARGSYCFLDKGVALFL